MVNSNPHIFVREISLEDETQLGHLAGKYYPTWDITDERFRKYVENYPGWGNAYDLNYGMGSTTTGFCIAYPLSEEGWNLVTKGLKLPLDLEEGLRYKSGQDKLGIFIDFTNESLEQVINDLTVRINDEKRQNPNLELIGIAGHSKTKDQQIECRRLGFMDFEIRVDAVFPKTNYMIANHSGEHLFPIDCRLFEMKIPPLVNKLMIPRLLGNLEPAIYRQRLIMEGHYNITNMNGETIRQYLAELSNILEMRVFSGPYSWPPDKWDNQNVELHELNGFVAWTESGAHTYAWRPQKFYTVDVYSCKPFDDKKVVKFTQEFFKSGDIIYRAI